MANLQGKWTFKADENMDAFMNAIGVPDEVKQKVGAVKPDVTISQNGETWTKTTTMGDKVTDLNFKLDEAFDHPNLMGQVIQSTVSLEGDKLVEKQTGGNHDVSVTREVCGDELVTTFSGNGAIGIVRFQRA